MFVEGFGVDITLSSELQHLKCGYHLCDDDKFHFLLAQPLLTFPKSHVELNKCMCVIGLVYQHTHCCPNDCIHFYGNYRDSQSCCICIVDTKRKIILIWVFFVLFLLVYTHY